MEDQLVNEKHKKQSLNEEIMRLNQKIDHTIDSNSRKNNQLQSVVKECEEKQVRLITIFDYFVFTKIQFD